MNGVSKSDSNKRLGYPADARLLIINADDFGMCHATNAAILRTITEGVVGSTTLMVPCAWSPEAMRMLTANPAISFGVHLTVIGDGLDYRWRPLTDVEKIPSLVDETGYFYNSERVSELLAQARVDELEMEFRAQIEAVLAAKLKPTHLDWHSIRIHRRPDFFEVMFKLARDYGLALRVRERASIEKVQAQGLPCNDYDFLDSSELETEGKVARYVELLRELPAGLTEWAVHPGLADAELRAIEPGMAAVRQADFECMIAEEVRDVIRQEGITLISYKQLQEVWQGT